MKVTKSIEFETVEHLLKNGSEKTTGKIPELYPKLPKEDIITYAYKCNNCWFVWHSYWKEIICRNESCKSTNIKEKIYEQEIRR